ncbi:DUF6168 family protein [Cellulophaga sp. F20128]|uniref:DUF6168 family protein n=1 Tax=Cellulophaga sp. F20128 TaxID=2926413 RepID=UPI001FF2DFD1|nr:DUF6168 family protein [Cellulophaga sp. F20128]MCK0155949.1 DUF6168 family protein [Cellulophaga sp. F20128]
MKHKLLVSFLATITLVTIVVFGLHVLVLDMLKEPLFANKIVLSYSLNAILATVIFALVYVLQNRYKNQLGFFFIGGSFLKFLFFFVFFYADFKADGNINALEFASFFVPYAICLGIETYFMAKVLHKLD